MKVFFLFLTYYNYLRLKINNQICFQHYSNLGNSSQSLAWLCSILLRNAFNHEFNHWPRLTNAHSHLARNLLRRICRRIRKNGEKSTRMKHSSSRKNGPSFQPRSARSKLTKTLTGFRSRTYLESELSDIQKKKVDMLVDKVLDLNIFEV